MARGSPGQTDSLADGDRAGRGVFRAAGHRTAPSAATIVRSQSCLGRRLDPPRLAFHDGRRGPQRLFGGGSDPTVVRPTRAALGARFEARALSKVFTRSRPAAIVNAIRLGFGLARRSALFRYLLRPSPPGTTGNTPRRKA